MKFVLAIDQGTTSTRAILFDDTMQPAATSQMEFEQHFPKSGWVEHDPNDLLNTTLQTCKDVIAKHGITASDIAAIGITNQRETTLVWDKTTGKAVHNAIVWQDRRTAPFCAELKAEGFEAEITHRTGLACSPIPIFQAPNSATSCKLWTAPKICCLARWTASSSGT